MLIQNCVLQPRSGETLFSARTEREHMELDVNLNGYAIIPIEDYEALKARAEAIRPT